MEPVPVIELRSLTCLSEEGSPVFEGAGLSLFPGERVLLVGPVASGKTLLMKLMAGLVRPDGGNVFLFGRDITGASASELKGLRKRMSFVFEDNVLISNLKAIENVALPLQYHSGLSYRDSLERAMAALKLTGFGADPWELPGNLPLYSRKEVCIARALVTGPEAIVCEGFFEGLTGAEKLHLTALLAGYQESAPATTLFFSSANDADASIINPGRLVRIEDGRFVEHYEGGA